MPLLISFTDEDKKATEWQKGYAWGLRWYLSGPDRGAIFKIRLKVKTITNLNMFTAY
ncbi:Envelope glycoprotein [Cricetulus griseus]|uniref:Envelope glycoprotein n=1 Tax=Cricetulus griseus TaxID=10029 RepID=G3HX13_CRIGR|nr:Envelope glycoprotein [Cricetulus griseus]